MPENEEKTVDLRRIEALRLAMGYATAQHPIPDAPTIVAAAEVFYAFMSKDE